MTFFLVSINLIRIAQREAASMSESQIQTTQGVSLETQTVQVEKNSIPAALLSLDAEDRCERIEHTGRVSQ